MQYLWKDGFVELEMTTYHEDLFAKRVPKNRANSTVYPNFYAEIVSCFPGVRKDTISLVRILSAPPSTKKLILNDILPSAFWRVFRGLRGQMPPRDMKFQSK